jgi:hypothetical protein
MARSSTAAGLSRIETAPGIVPRVSVGGASAPAFAAPLAVGGCQFALECPTGLNEERLVDGLVLHMEGGLGGEVAQQPAGTLLQRPGLSELLRHQPAQKGFCPSLQGLGRASRR